ncbi:hypothetical protein [Telluribacter sp. SYSU D00476]|uniref:hypothetical protein n=1 Tax=Telluribacter sp. SYSU D00476 TaxID=2811430 RepID=UPI001FF167B4|nr:hypothetical protein [Telluribacter sp. SYSU D00476]
MITQRLHYVSGLVLTIFIGLHLFNHLYGVAGVDRYLQVMDSLRLFYRHPLAEPLILMAVLVQIYTGIKIFRKKRNMATAPFERLHLWTGLYLAIFFVIHVGSVLTGRTVLHLDTNFYYGVAGLNTFPFNLFFIPYYGLAILSFFGHVAAIHHQKMKQPLLGWSPMGQSKAILTVGFMVMVLIFYGLTNRFQGVEIPRNYHVLIGK